MGKSTIKKCAAAAVAAAMLVVGIQSTQAAISWSLGTEFSGGATPSGPVLVTLNQQGSDVLLTVSAANLTGAEFITGLYLNYTGVLPLTFTSYNGPGVAIPTVSQGANDFKADGDGYFDIMLEFSTGNNGGARFGAGEQISWLIEDATESWFNALSLGEGNSPDGLFVAAKVQGIGLDGEGSGWVTVPEPSTVVAGALLLLPFAASTLRFVRKNRKA